VHYNVSGLDRAINDEAQLYDGVLFNTGRHGHLQTVIHWEDKKTELGALREAEGFLSQPLSESWYAAPILWNL
jgi:hypothetical protein